MTPRLALLACLLSTAAALAQADCNTIPHLDHPHALITNGQISAVLFLPDAARGYYRSSRFDWSGVIACATYRGHTLWGEWFQHYDPLGNDSITGPAEEFRPPEGAQDFAAATNNGLFVKIGVGVLRRDSAEPYQFGHTYPIVDHGRWSITRHRDSVTFRQQLQSPTGTRYDYTKTVSLHGTTIVLTHSLRNTGSAPLTTDVYNHDFFMLDHKPTGPGLEVRLPFTVTSNKPLEPQATIQGNRILFRAPIPAGGTVDGYLSGFDPSRPEDNRATVLDTETGFGVEQIGSLPVEKLYLWSIPSTLCPEAYVHLAVAPGQTSSWSIQYRLSVGEASH